MKINKKLIFDYFRERDKDIESLTQYTERLINSLEKDYGFTEFHSEIHKILKEIAGRKYHLIATHITGNEGQWLTAISIYLKENNDGN